MGFICGVGEWKAVCSVLCVCALRGVDTGCIHDVLVVCFMCLFCCVVAGICFVVCFFGLC